ncbi:MAG: DGQHR domain-containing protein [Candidatus Woesearchaeota archaeon]
MKLIIPALRVKQDARVNIYLTTFKVGQLKGLYEDKQILKDYYSPDLKAGGPKGYNRTIDPNRTKRILNYLSTRYEYVLPLLPSSLVLNVRNNRLKFQDSKHELLIGGDVDFYVIDGQHRIEGLLKHKESYEVPVTILEGLDEIKEAMQFLIINTTQKRVDPQLQLRDLFRICDKDFGGILGEVKEVLSREVLGSGEWKIEALKIAMELETQALSPWYDRVKLPNESLIPGKWKPIRENSFADTLRFICTGGNPTDNLSESDKKRYLLDYWKSINKAYPEAFDQKCGREYILTKSSGAGRFNTFFPSAYTLCAAKIVPDFDALLQRIKQAYPLRMWLKRKRGIFSGGSQGEFRRDALKFVLKVCPQLDYINEKAYEKMIKEGIFASQVKRAYNMMSPLKLKHVSFFNKDCTKYATGCYILVDLKKDKIRVYAGKSEDIKQRLKAHPKKYNLYSVEPCNKKEAEIIEGVLFHLIKEEVRENKVAPNKEGCPFCTQKK